MGKIKDILKGIGAVLIGSFGVSCVLYGIFIIPPLRANVHPIEVFGRMTGVILVGAFLLYLSHRLTKEMSRAGKIGICMIILILGVFGFAGVAFYNYMEYTEQGVEFETYSNYGISIEYPRGMYVLGDDTSNEAEGFLLFANDQGNKYVGVWWASAVPPPSGEEIALEQILEDFTENGHTDIFKGKIVETTKSGHRMVYLSMRYKSDGCEKYEIAGIWYCDVSQRLYYLYVETDDDEVTSSLFLRYLDSFVCH